MTDTTPAATLAPGNIVVEGPAQTAPDTKELRLALVCYGGVSLAIYMHGVTKEIHKLVQASAAFEDDSDTNPFQDEDTASVYWKALKGLAADSATSASARIDTNRPPAQPLATRVVVDIIAGTSAGGINGIFLAKALAGNHSQAALRDLWLNKGNIALLLAGPRWMHPWLKAAWFAVKSPIAILRRRDVPPLGGDDMCRWLYDALERMDRDGPAARRTRTLVPQDQTLNLFVPITDFHGYQREFPLDDPKYIFDRTHRHVLEFRYSSRTDENHFTTVFNHVLAFAARATSSFPGAFPPVGFEEYRRNFAADLKLHEVAAPLFREYDLVNRSPNDTQFIDGGVLDNYPFESAIRAIGLKPATCQVDRRLLFIEPDPEEQQPPSVGARLQAPTWLGTIWGGLSSIPRTEPIIDDLRALGRRNEAVARVRDVIETSFETIEQRILEYFKQLPQVGSLLDVLERFDTYGEMQTHARELEKIAARDSGFSHATYLRLRTRTLVDNYVNAIGRLRQYPAGSNHLAFVHGLVRHWLVSDREGAVGQGEQNAAVRHAERSREFLERIDLWYHERRIKFLIAALNWWYRDLERGYGDVQPPARAELDQTKARLYRYLWDLDQLLSSFADDPDIKPLLDATFDDNVIREAMAKRDIKGFAFRHDRTFTLLGEEIGRRLEAGIAGFEEELYRDLSVLCARWPASARVALLVRYIGFPFWDILVFPIQAMSGVGERDAVEILRMSPRDAQLLKPAPGTSKLRGTALHHFWAFFTREGRENDYLWGRLDAAERLIAMLFDDPAKPGPDVLNQQHHRHATWRRCCKEAFTSIVNEESGSLHQVRDVITRLRAQIAQL
jgi:patatin-related protein